jgi:hypothetical protein
MAAKRHAASDLVIWLHNDQTKRTGKFRQQRRCCRETGETAADHTNIRPAANFTLLHGRGSTISANERHDHQSNLHFV